MSLSTRQMTGVNANKEEITMIRLLIFLGLKLWEVGRAAAIAALVIGFTIVMMRIFIYFADCYGVWLVFGGPIFILLCVIVVILEWCDQTISGWVKRNWKRAGEIDQRRRERR